MRGIIIEDLSYICACLGYKIHRNSFYQLIKSKQVRGYKEKLRNGYRYYWHIFREDVPKALELLGVTHELGTQ